MANLSLGKQIAVIGGGILLVAVVMLGGMLYLVQADMPTVWADRMCRNDRTCHVWKGEVACKRIKTQTAPANTGVVWIWARSEAEATEGVSKYRSDVCEFRSVSYHGPTSPSASPRVRLGNRIGQALSD